MQLRMEKTLESLPLYRHKELYSYNEQYAQHKFFTDEDFVAEERLWKLKQNGECDCSNWLPMAEYVRRKYKDRYQSLKGGTVFAENFWKLVHLRNCSRSYAEYVMKAAVQGVNEKHIRFELLYSFFARKRVFGCDCLAKDLLWKKYLAEHPEHEEKMLKLHGIVPTYYNDTSYQQWLTFREMCKEAFKDGHRNICSVNEMMTKKIGL